MRVRNVFMMLVIVLIVGTLLPGCAAPTPVIVEREKVVEKPVVQTVVVQVDKAVQQTVVVEKAVEKTVVVEKNVTPTPKTTKTGGSLVYVINQEIVTLDPGAMSFAVEQMVGMQVYDQLFWLDANKELQPALATGYKVNADYTVYDVDLRQDVKFHDGEAFNADAAVAWYNRVMDPEFKIGGAITTIGKIDRVEKTGDYSIRFTLKSPGLIWLKEMSVRFAGMIGSVKAAEAAGTAFGSRPVGTGPFIFKEWLPGSHVKLARNPDYKWGAKFFPNQGPAYLDEVTFRFIAEDPSRTAAIESGGAHIISRTPYGDAVRLTEDPRYNVVANMIPGVPQMNHINVTVEPTNELAVRQAINYAVDTAGIVKTVYFGLTEPAYGPVNVFDPAFEPSLKTMYGYNPDKAREVLEAAGWVDADKDGIREKNGKKLSVIIGQNQGWNEWVEFLQANLQEVGFDATISTLTSAANTERGKSCKEALPCNGGVNFDALALNGFFGSKAANNWSCLNDAELDELLADADNATTLDARNDLIKKVQLHIMENAYEVPIVELAFYTTMQRSVEDVIFDANGFYPWLLSTFLAE